MAQFGLQPDGTIKLADGSTWNPSQPLPPENAAGFNATPMGSPVNGLGTMAPTAVVAPAAPAPVASGMFGNATVRAPVALPDLTAAALPTQMGAMPDLGAPPKVHLKFSDEGGLADKLGDFGALLLAASGNPAGTALINNSEQRRQNAFNVQKLGLQQQAEYQRQLALAQYKTANREPTALEQQAQAAGLTPGTPAYQSFIRNAVLAPVITTVNGQPMAYSREQLNSGISGSSAAPSYPKVTDASSYAAIKSGDHFLDPQGNVRVKP